MEPTPLTELPAPFGMYTGTIVAVLFMYRLLGSAPKVPLVLSAIAVSRSTSLPANTELDGFVRPVGVPSIVADMRLLKAKLPLPSDVTELGIVTDVRSLLENATWPIVVTEFGIIIDVRWLLANT